MLQTSQRLAIGALIAQLHSLLLPLTRDYRQAATIAGNVAQHLPIVGTAGLQGEVTGVGGVLAPMLGVSALRIPPGATLVAKP